MVFEIDVVFDLTVYTEDYIDGSYATNSYVEKDDSIQLNAQVVRKDGTTANVLWTSLTPEIATVDANGVVTALKAGKNADHILTALASSSSTDWVDSMTPAWSLKTQATGADITSQFLFKDGEYKGADGEALVNYTTWAGLVDNWVDTAFKGVEQLTDEQKETYGITTAMEKNIEEVRARIK